MGITKLIVIDLILWALICIGITIYNLDYGIIAFCLFGIYASVLHSVVNMYKIRGIRLVIEQYEDEYEGEYEYEYEYEDEDEDEDDLFLEEEEEETLK